jgi:hypothetical protein
MANSSFDMSYLYIKHSPPKSDRRVESLVLCLNCTFTFNIADVLGVITVSLITLVRISVAFKLMLFKSFTPAILSGGRYFT